MLGVVRPIASSLRVKIPGNMEKSTFPHFLSDGAITIRNILTRGVLYHLTVKSKCLVLRQFPMIITVQLIILIDYIDYGLRKNSPDEIYNDNVPEFLCTNRRTHNT